jgi:hypothetical protein
MSFPTFPHLTAQEFTKAVTTFDHLCQHIPVEDLKDWNSVSAFRDKSSTASLRVVRICAVPANSGLAKENVKTEYTEDGNIEETDDDYDEDVVHDGGNITQPGKSDLSIEYDVAYSPFYQVPVLYFFVRIQTGSTKQPVMDLEKIYQYLVPSSQKAYVKDNDVLGAISTTVCFRDQTATNRLTSLVSSRHWPSSLLHQSLQYGGRPVCARRS